MSLKSILHQKVKEKGILTYGEVVNLCLEEGYKADTARRRLDELEDIDQVWSTSKRGVKYVSAYKWKPDFVTDESKKFLQGTGPYLDLKFSYKVYEPITNLRDPQ